MLAELGNKAGYKIVVIDLFADQDTQGFSEQIIKVTTLALVDVQKAVAVLQLSFNINRVVYGSGLEACQDSLAWLASSFLVTGNQPAIHAQFRDKPSFFKQLKQLNIPFPDVQFAQPKQDGRWLIKPYDHVGGLGVREVAGDATKHEYYQKYMIGQVGSVLFCADGLSVDIIGFQRQWTVSQDDFTFSGLVSKQLLPVHEQNNIQAWLSSLMRYYSLQGLGGLDFIWDGQRCYFLEVNLRPPASVMLYPELDLFNAHIFGKKVTQVKDDSVRALQIVYAQEDYKLSTSTKWPEWSFDRPENDVCFQVGEPICSIMAHGKTVQQALQQLLDRQKFLENTILILNR